MGIFSNLCHAFNVYKEGMIYIVIVLEAGNSRPKKKKIEKIRLRR